jgi:LysM repeat protein
VTIAIVIVVALATGQAAQALGGSGGRPPTRDYVVRPGDTLWAIAVRAGGDRDPRELTQAIAALNDVESGHIVPGQLLQLPADA